MVHSGGVRVLGVRMPRGEVRSGGARCSVPRGEGKVPVSAPAKSVGEARAALN